MNISKYTIGIISPAFDSFLYWSHILENAETFTAGGHTHHCGFTNGLRVVILGCSMEAVTSSLADFPLPQFGQITHLVYMGYAGSLNEKVKVGDLVLASHMITSDLLSNANKNNNGQHHIDLEISMNTKISSLLHLAAQQVILESTIDPLISAEQERQFGLNGMPAILQGHVGVGEPFYISQAKKLKALKYDPKLICLEKEGMAVAMISKQFALPLGVIHIIVQAEDDFEPIDYVDFITDVANRYLVEISLKFIHLFSEFTTVK
jgi:adenosylhomocysteine nucleosidase